MVNEERKRNARPLVTVSALCIVQCFDPVGWLTGRTSKPCVIDHKSSLPEQVKEENRVGTG